MDKLRLNGALGECYYYQLGRKEVRISGLTTSISNLSELANNEYDLIEVTLRKRIGDKYIDKLIQEGWADINYSWKDEDESILLKHHLEQDIGFRSIARYNDLVVKTAKEERDIAGIHRELRVLEKVKDIPHVVQVLFTVSRKSVVIGFAMKKLDMIDDEEAPSAYVEIRDVVEVLHDRGIYHLDIRQDNVMKDDEGKYVLIDFGLAECDNGNSKVENYSREAVSILGKYNNFLEFDRLMLEILKKVQS